MVAKVAPEFTKRSAEEVVIQLNALLSDNRAKQSRHQQIEDEQQAQQDYQDSEITIQTTDDRLDALRGERIHVKGMSSGTRGQLCLALRLAALEKYMESSEPMPFIVDDILVHFDDNRSKTTLAVLAELTSYPVYASLSIGRTGP